MSHYGQTGATQSQIFSQGVNDSDSDLDSRPGRPQPTNTDLFGSQVPPDQVTLDPRSRQGSVVNPQEQQLRHLQHMQEAHAQAEQDAAFPSLSDEDRAEIAKPVNPDLRAFVQELPTDPELVWTRVHERLVKFYVYCKELFEQKTQAEAHAQTLEQAARERQQHAAAEQQVRQELAQAQAQLRQAKILNNDLTADGNSLRQQNARLRQDNEALQETARRASEQAAAARNNTRNPPEPEPAFNWPPPPPPAPRDHPPAPPVQQPAVTINKHRKIPDPPMYDGSRDTLEGWMTQLYIKLTLNEDQYPLDTEKLFYAYSRLSGDAERLMRAYVSFETGQLLISELTDLGSFCRVLENAYGDPNKALTAHRQLRAHKQKTNSFAWYKSEFMRLMSIVKYTGVARTNALKDGLSWELQLRLSEMWDQPTDFDALCARLDTIDQNMRSFGEDAKKYAPKNFVQHAFGAAAGSNNRSTPSNNNNTPAANLHTTQAPVNRNAQGQFVAPQAPRGSVALPAGDPMDLSAIKFPPARPPLGADGKLPQTERDRRRAAGLCNYCGLHQYGTQCDALARSKAQRPQTNISVVDTAAAPQQPAATQQQGNA